jgi:hypothetical protein
MRRLMYLNEIKIRTQHSIKNVLAFLTHIQKLETFSAKSKLSIKSDTRCHQEIMDSIHSGV